MNVNMTDSGKCINCETRDKTSVDGYCDECYEYMYKIGDHSEFPWFTILAVLTIAAITVFNN